MNRILFCLMPLLLVVPLLGAQPVAPAADSTYLADGVGEVLWPDTLPEAQARQQARRLAIQQALEHALGLRVHRETHTQLAARTAGQEATQVQRMQVRAHTQVQGEWLKTKAIRYEVLPGTDERGPQADQPRTLRAYVQGVVRPLDKAHPKLHLQLRSCPEPGCQTTQFQAGDALYLQAWSPEPRYVAAYLSDGHTAYRVLPYHLLAQQQHGGMPLPAQQQLLLFHPPEGGSAQATWEVDELRLTALEAHEAHSLILLHSAEPLQLPQPEADAQQRGFYTLPPSMPQAAFDEWLFRARLAQPHLAVTTQDFIVSNPQP